MIRQLTAAEANERIELVCSARREERGNFVRLVERARLDPGKDLRFGNWSGIDFRGCNLAGYDFTGAVLTDCGFNGARVNAAIFAQVEFGYGLGHAWRLSDAIDWNNIELTKSGQRLSDHLSTIDEHISIGSLFQDAAAAPLMKCILAAQPNGVGAKYAVQIRTQAPFGVRVVGDMDEAYEKRTTALALNTALSLPSEYHYRIIGKKRILLDGPHVSHMLACGWAEFDEVSGFVVCTGEVKDHQYIAVGQERFVRRMASGSSKR
jgi:hypothetical protein